MQILRILTNVLLTVNPTTSLKFKFETDSVGGAKSVVFRQSHP